MKSPTTALWYIAKTFGLLVCQLSTIKYCSLKNIICYTKSIVKYHINACNKCYLLGYRNSFILICEFLLYYFFEIWESENEEILWNLTKKNTVLACGARILGS